VIYTRFENPSRHKHVTLVARLNEIPLIMQADVYSNEILIGTTDLKLGDESMGCVFGEFLPNQNYYDKIQKVVWKFWETNKPDYKEWYSLRLNVQLENGYFLYPIGGYTIDDMEDLKDESKRIEITGLYRHVIDDFFKSDKPKELVGKPWHYVSIRQKIAFENELKKELGFKREKSFFDIFKGKPDNHILLDFNCSALCKDQRNDDVLFVTHNQTSNNAFAVVHLTWSGKKEYKNFPSTHFYKDFEDFKRQQMDIDISEWED
jgi:hypothetical protein